ncbi:glycosyltransferase family 4 protein [Olleya sp. UBA1516]|uniref:glycosyltransferase family 4 protein n=1 Tax=Olleya sp. UBA1516 TaxID=1947013 RepID=UPI0025E5D142|nr:glycosyltransferase family 4 protein [Olleya sp. UBA1516]|tara:strand:+ start:8100 stop:9227 length:1128 start_codon:yes stop_codon:yes gene_type:complete
MKVVIGTSTPFHLVHLARELSSSGHEVTVIGYMPKWKMKKYNLGDAKYICLFWYLFPLSITALQRFFPKIQRATTFLIMPLVDWLITKKMTKCDVFVGLSGVCVSSLKYAKSKYGALSIVDRGSAHVKSQIELIEGIKEIKLPKLYISRELEGYDIADKIVIPSIFAYNTFVDNNINKEKLFINNYGINLLRFYAEKKILSKGKKINALFVGGWSFQKGVDIINKTLQKDFNLHVSHIGIYNGEHHTDSDNFKRIGYVPNDKLINYYNSFDVLLLPSRQDGFGMVILEALACGLPIITSANTGGPDVKAKIDDKDSVIIMDSIDEIGLIKALQKFRNKRVKLTSCELTDADKEKYSWQSYGIRYSTFINSLKDEK